MREKKHGCFRDHANKEGPTHVHVVATSESSKSEHKDS